MKKIFLMAAIAAFAWSLSTEAKKPVTASYYNHETECLGVEMDGSQTLKCYGTGRYKLDAMRMAQKQAVRDVLFKGNFIGSSDCFDRPLITEVNAQEKYENYFNVFFKDGGEYQKYVNLKDEKILKSVFRGATARNSEQSTYTMVVRVMRVELKAKLIQDGILNP